VAGCAAAATVAASPAVVEVANGPPDGAPDRRGTIVARRGEETGDRLGTPKVGLLNGQGGR